MEDSIVTTSVPSLTNLTTTSPHNEPTTSQLLKIGVYFGVCTVLFVGGLFGNTAIAYIILTHKKMHTATNWLVFNLSLSGILIAIFTVPTVPITQLSEEQKKGFTLGKFTCHILPVCEMFAGVCVLTHTAVAWSRYWVVRTHRDISNRTIGVTICAIWCLSFFFMAGLQMGILGKVVHFKIGSGKYVCGTVWYEFGKSANSTTSTVISTLNTTSNLTSGTPSCATPVKLGRQIYIFFVFTLTYIIPVVLTGFAYQRIGKISGKSLRKVSDHLDSHAFQARMKGNRRMNKILMNMYGIFAITTIPWQIFLFVKSFLPCFMDDSPVPVLFLALFFAQIVAVPIILFYQSIDYRSRVYNLPICCCVDMEKRNFYAERFKDQLFETAGSLGRRMSNFRKISTFSGFRIMPGSSVVRKKSILSNSSNGSIINRLHQLNETFHAENSHQEDTQKSSPMIDKDQESGQFEANGRKYSSKGRVSFSTGVTILNDGNQELNIRKPSMNAVPRKSSILSSARKPSTSTRKVSTFAPLLEESEEFELDVQLAEIVEEDEEGAEEESKTNFQSRTSINRLNSIDVATQQPQQQRKRSGRVSTAGKPRKISASARRRKMSTPLPTFQDFASGDDMKNQRKYSTPVLPFYDLACDEDMKKARNERKQSTSSNVLMKVNQLSDILKNMSHKRRRDSTAAPVVLLKQRFSSPALFDFTYTPNDDDCSILQNADRDSDILQNANHSTEIMQNTDHDVDILQSVKHSNEQKTNHNYDILQNTSNILCRSISDGIFSSRDVSLSPLTLDFNPHLLIGLSKTVTGQSFDLNRLVERETTSDETTQEYFTEQDHEYSAGADSVDNLVGTVEDKQQKPNQEITDIIDMNHSAFERSEPVHSVTTFHNTSNVIERESNATHQGSLISFITSSEEPRSSNEDIYYDNSENDDTDDDKDEERYAPEEDVHFVPTATHEQVLSNPFLGVGDYSQVISETMKLLENDESSEYYTSFSDLCDKDNQTRLNPILFYDPDFGTVCIDMRQFQETDV